MPSNQALTDWLARPGGLATRLREARIAAGLSGSQLARELDWHQSKVSRVETGRTLPAPEDITAWSGAVKLPATERRELLQLQSEAAVRQLRFRGATDQAEHQRSFVEMHRQATSIVFYDTYLIPAPLQIEPYGEAVLRAWFGGARFRR